MLMMWRLTNSETHLWQDSFEYTPRNSILTCALDWSSMDAVTKQVISVTILET